MNHNPGAALSPLQTRNLSWGTCTFCSRSRSRRRRKIQESVSLPSLVLLGTSSSNRWILCRHVKKGGDLSDAILGYDESIQVIASESLRFSDWLEVAYHGTVTSDNPCPAASSHSHLKLSSIGTGDIVVATPKEDPSVALSLLLEVRVEPPPLLGKSPTLPLLQSVLKRQLVGSVLVFQDGVLSSTLKLLFREQVWTFRVISVLIEKKQRRAQTLFFWILPSTRITLEMKDFVDQDVCGVPPTTDIQCLSSNNADLTCLSSTSRLLIDVITGIQRTGANLSRAFLLTGPPGVGKTHAVRVAKNYFDSIDPTSVQLVSLHGSEITSIGHVSEANRLLERHFQRAARFSQQSSSKPAVVVLIFLDECEALVEDDGMAAMLAVMLDNVSSLWTRIVVVAATNRVDDIPAFLRRPGRLDKEIPLSPPNAEERKVVLASLLRKNLGDDIVIGEDELREIADSSVGFVPADLDLLVRRAAQLRFTNANSMNLSLFELLSQSMFTVGASALRDASLSAPPKMSWDDIAGDPGGAKTALRRAIEWPRTKREAFVRLGLSTPRGILLHGPPGCAKTSLARAAAAASSVTFLSFAPADVYASSYVGDAEAVIRRGFSLARSAAPCILFFDEIDAIVGFDNDFQYGGGLNGINRGQSAEARVLSTFLNEMDGVDGSWEDGVLVLGATNRPWTLDAALLRPGRFDKIIYVPPPVFDGRRSILQMQCHHWPTATPFDFDYLASEENTGNMTGAEIVGACRETARNALCHALQSGASTPVLRQEDLEAVLRGIQPLLSNKVVMQKFSMFEHDRNRS